MSTVRNHACFKASGTNINTICQNYFANAPLHYLGHARLYPNGKFYFLVSDLAWTESLFANNKITATSLPGGFMNYYEIEEGIYFPNMQECHKAFAMPIEFVIAARDQFNIKHPMIIIKKYETCMEIFYIDFHFEDPYEFYITQQAHFENFIAYFKDQTRDLIQSFQSNLLQVDPCYVTEMQANQEIQIQQALAQLSPYKINYRDLYHNGTFTLVSEREYDCLGLLAKGGTAKTIGQSLHISDRTVECHFSNLKSKFNLSSKQELIDLYRKNKFIK